MTHEGHEVVAVVDVSKAYPGPPRVDALTSVNLTLRQGEHVSLVGRSGSGKSTLLNLIGLLDRPTSGEVRINGCSTGHLSDDELAGIRAAYIGYVFQSFELLDRRTACENVMLGFQYRGFPRRGRRAAAMDVLERVGLADRAAADVAHLSGGERQRVAIARALSGSPELLLCDEPTGNLDSENATGVLAVLHELQAAGTAVLVVTHDSHVAAQSSRIITIRDGIAH